MEVPRIVRHVLVDRALVQVGDVEHRAQLRAIPDARLSFDLSDFGSGGVRIILTSESGVGLENALAPLRIWHAAGVRLMTLCHNESLDWVDSATDAPRNGGLNAFGRAVIGELNRLGIVVDLDAVARRGQARRHGRRKDRAPNKGRLFGQQGQRIGGQG